MIQSNRLGCRRDVRDARDHQFRSTRISIPAKTDLRENCPPVMDQGELGSCVWHASTSALRYLLLSKGHRDIKFSRLQGYYDTREIEGTIASDAGCEIRDAIKTLAKKGVAHETLWPYKVAKFAKKPPEKVYADAVKFRALKYNRCSVDHVMLRRALASGFPIVIGVSLYQSFEDIRADGIMKMPNLAKEQVIGGHAMLVVGHNQHKNYFTVRNSWSEKFGDYGDIYMPFEYLGSPKYGADYWVIKAEGTE